MKNFNILMMLGACLFAFNTPSMAQSDEDMEIMRAKKAFKTKMTEEIVILKTEHPQANMSTPVMYVDNKASIPKSTPILETIKEPVVFKEEDKSKVRLAFYVNGEKHHTSRGLYNDDQSIAFKAFSMNGKNELVILEMQVEVHRNGQKIKSETHTSSTNIHRLVNESKEGDQFAIVVKEIFEKTDEGHLRAFSKGTMKVLLNHY